MIPKASLYVKEDPRIPEGYCQAKMTFAISVGGRGWGSKEGGSACLPHFSVGCRM